MKKEAPISHFSEKPSLLHPRFPYVCHLLPHYSLIPFPISPVNLISPTSSLSDWPTYGCFWQLSYSQLLITLAWVHFLFYDYKTPLPTLPPSSSLFRIKSNIRIYTLPYLCLFPFHFHYPHPRFSLPLIWTNNWASCPQSHSSCPEVSSCCVGFFPLSAKWNANSKLRGWIRWFLDVLPDLRPLTLTLEFLAPSI